MFSRCIPPIRFLRTRTSVTVRSRPELGATTGSFAVDALVGEIEDDPLAESSISRRKSRTVTASTSSSDQARLFPGSDPDPALENFLGDLNVLSYRHQEMLERLARESSVYLDEVHGKTAQQRVSQIRQRLLIAKGRPGGISKLGPPCSGCGAFLHSEDVRLPGFAPPEALKPGDGSGLPSSPLCLRCYTLNAHRVALKVEVDADAFPALLSDRVCAGLRDKPRAVTPLGKAVEKIGVLLFVLLDAFDPEGSVFTEVERIVEDAEREIPDSILTAPQMKRRGGVNVILVVNKVDLLPKDSPDAHDRLREVATATFLARTRLSPKRLLATHIVSARTGFGVEELITDTWSRWHRKGDIYLVGACNAGKSTLFNVLLRSDFCAPPAMDQVTPATVSQWPGTTLDLLKFPLNPPTDFKIKMRLRRLRISRRGKEEQQQPEKQQPSKDDVSEEVGLTFERQRRSREQLAWLRRRGAENRVDRRAFVSFEGNGRGGVRDVIDPDWDALYRKENPDAKHFDLQKHEKAVDSRWLLDTPGVVDGGRLIACLIERELEEVLPRSSVSPRFCLLRSGRSLLISGLVQIDFLGMEDHKDMPIYLSIVASPELPLKVAWDSTSADSYRRANKMSCEYSKMMKPILPLILAGDDPTRGTAKLESSIESKPVLIVESDESEPTLEPLDDSSTVSFPPSLRPRPLPPFSSETLRVAGSENSRWFEDVSAEIALPSVGFVGVAAPRPCFLRVWTYGGKNGGVVLRDTPLLPRVFSLKGERAGGRVREEGKKQHWSPFYRPVESTKRSVVV